MLTRRQLIIHSGGAFSPTSLPAVVGWLRVANATVTGAGVSSLPDVLGGPAAIQTTDANRPPLGTSGNGLPILQFSGTGFLTHPLDGTVNNNANYFGLAMWMRSPLSAGNRSVYAVRSTTGGASAHRFYAQIVSGEDVATDIYLNNSNARRLRTAVSQVLNNVWQFWTFEFQGNLTGDARFIMSRDNSPYTATYSDGVGTAGEMPATMVVPTGSALIGTLTTTMTSPFTGDIGPNMYFLNRQLTSGERLDLMSFEVPT